MNTDRRLFGDPAAGGVFHCVSRCARHAFLCGRDAYSGRDVEHRRVWVADRLQELAGLFAVELYAHSVMTTHVHVVVRTVPERVAEWTDAEVARRWLLVFAVRGSKRSRPPEACSILALCQDREKLAACRARLADVSWFIRCLKEPIACRANREDGCKGHFWEARFKCQRLDEAGALLACMAFVDHNPVRPGIAETPESSGFIRAQDRSVA